MDQEGFVASLSSKLYQSITAEHLAKASSLGLDAGKQESGDWHCPRQKWGKNLMFQVWELRPCNH